MKYSRFKSTTLGLALAALSVFASAQVGTTSMGSASIRLPLKVPPGVGGVQPSLALTYNSANGSNGALGIGWSLSGLAAISRCTAITGTDGGRQGVSYQATDKLCLDGQRLIPTDASGAAPSVGTKYTTPAGGLDAGGLAPGAFREYRTELDGYSRIRAYGMADPNNADGGPAFFRVWTKTGQILDFGANPDGSDSASNALIRPTYPNIAGQPTVNYAQTWALSKQSDQFGNSAKYIYAQNTRNWGSRGAYQSAREWYIREIQYSGVKVLFNYWTRTNSSPQDASERYNSVAKNVSMARLSNVLVYVNAYSPEAGVTTGAVPTRSWVMGYSRGTVTQRSRLTEVQECAGLPDSGKCLPKNIFGYSQGLNEAYTKMTNVGGYTRDIGKWVPRTVDLDGDGRQDIVSLAHDYQDPPNFAPVNHFLFSKGDGTFEERPTNLKNERLRQGSCIESEFGQFNGDGLVDIIRLVNDAYVYPSTYPRTECDKYPGVTHKVFINNGGDNFTGYPLVGVDPQKYTAYYAKDWTGAASVKAGTTFYVLDFDGDGKQDIITTMFPEVPVWNLDSPNPNPCANIVCTRVFKAMGVQGGNYVFSEVPTNLANTSIYAFPRTNGNAPRTIDLDGDGLSDLLLNTQAASSPAPTFAVRSRGDGNFDVIEGPLCSGSTEVCTGFAIDYRGDGRVGLLLTGAPATTNKLATLDTRSTVSVLQNSNVSAIELLGTLHTPNGIINAMVADFNGDGRDDIFKRMEQSPNEQESFNELWLSNGDGTFTKSTSFNISGKLKYDLLPGDFFGKGYIQLLHDDYTETALYYKVGSINPPDILVSAKFGTEPETTISYLPLAAASVTQGTDSLGPRYVSDRGTPNAATGNLMDLTGQMMLVRTLVTGTGVGSGTRKTEFKYYGLKAAKDGRGIIGFREIRSQEWNPSGKAITTVTKYMLDHPYSGMVQSTARHFAAINDVSDANRLTLSTSIYCDITSAAGADAAATSAAPCPAAGPLYAPYVRSQTQAGVDLDLTSALPTVTVVSSDSASGSAMTKYADPTKVVTTKTFTGGASDTYTTTETMTYAPDNIACSDIFTCSWIVGRVASKKVTNKVPSTMLSTSAGTGPYATAVAGVPLAKQFATPSVQSCTSRTVNTAGLCSLKLKVADASGGPVTISSVTSSSGEFINAGFNSQPNVPGAEVSLSVQFKPAAVGTRTGNLLVYSDAVNSPLTVPLTGIGLEAVSSLTIPTFASQPVGNSVLGTAVIANTGTSEITITEASVTGADFSIDGGNLIGATVYPNGTYSFPVRFSPVASGTRTGTLKVVASHGDMYANLSGSATGTPGLAVTACSITTRTWAPNAASLECDLKNIGAAGVASVAYTTGTGTAVVGPTGACAAGAVCGKVKVTTDVFDGTYSGTLVATPNVGAPARVPYTLTVYLDSRKKAYAVVRPVSSSGATESPEPAWASYQVGNAGSNAVTLSYTAPAGTTVSGPTTCAANTQNCGTVTVTSGTAEGTYSGNLTTTTVPADVQPVVPVSLTVGPPPAKLTYVSAAPSLTLGTIPAYSGDSAVLTYKNTGGQSMTVQALTITSQGGGGSVIATSANSGQCYPGRVLAPAASCTYLASFDLAPYVASSMTVRLAFTNGQSDTKTVTATGQGLAVTFPSGNSFTVPLNGTKVATAVFTNSTDAPFKLAATAAVAWSNRTGFATTTASATPGSNTCPAILAAGASCQVQLTWSSIPNVYGQGTIDAVLNGEFAYRTGSGAYNQYRGETHASEAATFTASIVQESKATWLSTATQDFGAQWYGANPSSLTWTFRNDGNTPLTQALATSPQAPLSQTANTCTNVAPGATCQITLRNSWNNEFRGQANSQSFGVEGATTGAGTLKASYVIQSAVPGWGTAGLNFGTVAMGESKTLNVVLTNYGITNYNWAANNQLANLPADFTMDFSACTNVTAGPGGQQPGGSCVVPVTFTPTVQGARGGSNVYLTARSYLLTQSSLSLSATGSPPFVPLTASPATLALDSVGSTPTQSETGTITFSSGSTNTPSLITGLSIPSSMLNYGFAITGGTCVQGGTLAGGASCTVVVTASGTQQCERGAVTLTMELSGRPAATARVSRLYKKTTVSCP